MGGVSPGSCAVSRMFRANRFVAFVKHPLAPLDLPWHTRLGDGALTK